MVIKLKLYNENILIFRAELKHRIGYGENNRFDYYHRALPERIFSLSKK